MKKLLVLAVVAAALFAMVPAHATHAPRTVSGSVLVPSPTGPTGLVSRHARCAYLLAGDASQGIFGHVITLSAAEGDGLHSYALTSSTPGGDVDVVFYEDLGTCDGVTGPNPTGAIAVDGPGDEAGTIPEFAAFAIVVVQNVTQVGFSFAVS